MEKKITIFFTHAEGHYFESFTNFIRKSFEEGKPIEKKGDFYDEDGKFFLTYAFKTIFHGPYARKLLDKDELLEEIIHLILYGDDAIEVQKRYKDFPSNYSKAKTVLQGYDNHTSKLFYKFDCLLVGDKGCSLLHATTLKLLIKRDKGFLYFFLLMIASVLNEDDHLIPSLDNTWTSLLGEDEDKVNFSVMIDGVQHGERLREWMGANEFEIWMGAREVLYRQKRWMSMQLEERKSNKLLEGETR